METFRIQVRVKYKEGILDPQAIAIQSALEKLEFSGVKEVECDKVYVLSINAENESQALGQGRDMANKLLANVVMENFEVEVAN